MSCCCSRVWFLGLALSPGIVFAQDTGHLPKASDWNRIHALSPGVITRVKILKDEAPRGERNVKGFFSSSTDHSITILFQNGTTRTIEKAVISTVRVRRPFKKRITGWVIGISTAIVTGYLYFGGLEQGILSLRPPNSLHSRIDYIAPAARWPVSS